MNTSARHATPSPATKTISYGTSSRCIWTSKGIVAQIALTNSQGRPKIARQRNASHGTANAIAKTQCTANEMTFKLIHEVKMKAVVVPKRLAPEAGSRVIIVTAVVMNGAEKIGNHRFHGPCLQAEHENTSSMRSSAPTPKTSTR